MAIRWWDPMSDVLQTHRMMERVFEHFFENGTALVPGESEKPTYYLRLDILEAEDAYLLSTAVPGFTPEQVEVTLEDGILTIQAQADHAPPAGRWIRRERAQGNLVRRLELPRDIQGDKISAAFDNGLLTVTVPKLARPEPVKIAVDGVMPRQQQLADKN